MIEEGWGFGGNEKLCLETESQTKPVTGLPASRPQSVWENIIQEVINQSAPTLGSRVANSLINK